MTVSYSIKGKTYTLTDLCKKDIMSDTIQAICQGVVKRIQSLEQAKCG